MTSHLITASPQMRLMEADRVMMRRGVRRLPVASHGRLVGIVTRGDVRSARPSEATSLTIWEINYLLSQLTLEQVMTPHPITVAPEATIGEAAALMLNNKISGLPVVDQRDKLVGIITESDIFRLVSQSWQEVGPAMDDLTIE